MTTAGVTLSSLARVQAGGETGCSRSSTWGTLQAIEESLRRRLVWTYRPAHPRLSWTAASSKPAELELDARGIPLGFYCDDCRHERLSRFRPDVLTDPNYWTDEPIDPD